MWCAACLVLATQQWIEPKFVNVVPDGQITPVKRKNNRYPLWDQGNTGHWSRFEPMWDDFNGHYLNPKKWLDHYPTWLGRQPAWFNPANVEVSNGLNLTARVQDPPANLATQGYHTFSTAAVQSVASVLYGAFEIRARPMNSGASSSFWFSTSDSNHGTEIDVFEIGGKAKGFERKDHMTVHVWKTPEVAEHHGVGGVFVNDEPLADDFHDYGLEWTPQEIKFYFDGVLVRKGPNPYWHYPLVMDFDSETMPDWFGLPDPADLPSTYTISFVRAWQRGQ